VPLIDYGKEQMTDFSYSEGALLFHLLYGVVGPERFRGIIGGFSQQYATTGASTGDLVRFANRTARMNLKPLFDDWVYTTGWWPAIKNGATYAELVRRYRRRRGP
jgi:aminopeptidase N